MTKRMWKAGMARLSLALMLGMISLTTTNRAFAQGDKPAAIINGEIITEQEFFERLQRLRAPSFVITTTPLQMRSDSAGEITLEAMIVERLTIQAANKEKVALTDDETNAQLAILKLQPQVVDGLNKHLYTDEMLKQDIRVQGARFKLSTLGIKVTPEEVEKYYKDHITEFTVPEQWGLSVIRTGNPEKLSKVQADLKTGKSFAETAKIYSEDPGTKDKGGDIGTIVANDPRIPQALKDTVKPMKLGEISQPIRLEQDAGPGKPKIVTWWMVLLKSKTPETVRTLNDMKLAIERQAMIEKAGGYKSGDKKITDLRDQSEIKINLSGYDGLAHTK